MSFWLYTKLGVLMYHSVGAGILALPAFTVKSGFLPSTAALLGAWVVSAHTQNMTGPCTTRSSHTSHTKASCTIPVAPKDPQIAWVAQHGTRLGSVRPAVRPFLPWTNRH